MTAWQLHMTIDNRWQMLTTTDDHWLSLTTTEDSWWPLTTTDDRWQPLTTSDDCWRPLTTTDICWQTLMTADNHWQTWTCLYCSGFPTNFALILKFPKLFSFKIFPSLLAKQQNRRWHQDFSTNVIGRSYLSERWSLKKSCW